MLRRYRAIGVTALLVLSLASVACDGDNPTTTPTPPPAPTPTPTPPPPPPPPAAPAALASVTLNPATVQSQGQATGTVTLTAAAPTGGAVVVLNNGNETAIKMPTGVTVQAGATTATFTIETSTVSASTQVQISATYSGVTERATLTVLPPPLEPRFTVTSASQGADVCAIVSAAGAVDCTLNASGSGGFPALFRWTVQFNGRTLELTPLSEPAFIPTTNCGFLGGASSPDIQITLELEDRAGSRSGQVSRTARLAPQGFCGY